MPDSAEDLGELTDYPLTYAMTMFGALFVLTMEQVGGRSPPPSRAQCPTSSAPWGPFHTAPLLPLPRPLPRGVLPCGSQALEHLHNTLLGGHGHGHSHGHGHGHGGSKGGSREGVLEPESLAGVEFRAVTVSGPVGDGDHVGKAPRAGYSTFEGGGEELAPLVPPSSSSSTAVAGDDQNTSFIRAVLMDASIAGVPLCPPGGGPCGCRGMLRDWQAVGGAARGWGPRAPPSEDWVRSIVCLDALVPAPLPRHPRPPAQCTPLSLVSRWASIRTCSRFGCWPSRLCSTRWAVAWATSVPKFLFPLCAPLYVDT
jgi:hypothetical protein